MSRKLWPGLLLNLAAAIFGLAQWGKLPARVASHWGAHGEVNGWSSRGMLVVLIPLIALLMAVVVLLGVYVPGPVSRLVQNAATFVEVKP